MQLVGEDTDCERVAGGPGRAVQARLGCFGVCIHLSAGGLPAHSHQALTSYLLQTPTLPSTPIGLFQFREHVK